ncbi:MAG: serine hydrolase [Verrucomicrobiota bacterium]|jgi:CubicO group peptidase (beta-lactamase class C family)
MKRFIPLFLLVMVCGAVDRTPSALPRSTPEAEGIPSVAILDFIAAAEQQVDALHSFVLVRHGHVVAEGWWSPYGAASPHELYSLSKSFTSTAVGLAVAEGRMSLDDPVLSWFPGDAPAEPSANLKAMRVRDLLCMSTGHDKEPPTGADVVSPKAFLAQPVTFKPGTHFLYNTAATFMLSAIVEKATGQHLLDYLKPRLFTPLGIADPTWATNFQGTALGGYGLSVRTEDIARFGQLYLRKGRWQGKELLPASWVAMATARQTSNGSNPNSDWDQGYGFQFWRCRHGAYRGDGAFGQYCLVMPEQDAVLAITSGLGDMPAVLNLVWTKLLPAMQPHLPRNAPAQNALRQKLASLKLRPPAGSATTPRLAPINGRQYVFPANDQRLESLTLQAADGREAVTLLARVGGVEQRLVCGYGDWVKGQFPLGIGPAQPAAGAGAWTTEDTYTAKVHYYETPFCVTMTLRFTGDQLFLDWQRNVAFGPTRPPQLVGQAK